jgi:tRNA pseudouridine55 synthase
MRDAGQASGFVVIHKPAGITSFDVIRECRRILRIKKLGHSGVLDRPAMGVLVVGANKATRLFELFSSFEKEYIGDIWLGISTTTDDHSGELVARGGSAAVSRDEVERALAHYVGEIEQIPPAFSLTKLAGRELYRYALEGREVEVEPKRVTVNSYEILEFEQRAQIGDYIDPESKLRPALAEVGLLTRIRVRWSCIGGVYVRSIARDVGSSLGTLGCLGYLLRTRVGPFTLEQALSTEELAGRLDGGASLASVLRPLSSIAPAGSQIALDAVQLSMVRNGQPIRRFRQQLPPQAGCIGDTVFGMDQGENLVALFSVGDTNSQGLVELKPEKVLN